MILSRLAVTRPVFATVVNLLLVVLGITAALRLPVRQYPDIDPPVISVSVVYAGASSSVIESEVTRPIEEALAGISGIRLITATSFDEAAQVQIEFSLDRDLDAAAADVRDKIGQVRERLPDDVNDPVIQKEATSSRPMMWISLTSDSRDPMQLSDYAERQMVDRLSTVDGISRVIVGGGKRFAMRVWIDRDALGARGLTVADLVTRLRAENLEIPAGRIESQQREMAIRVMKGLDRPEDFAALVLRDNPEGRVLLGDVARIEVGSETYRTDLRINGQTSIGLGIVRQARSNTLEVAQGIKQRLAEITPHLPDDLHVSVAYDESTYIEESIAEVQNTLLIAFGLVVLVIMVFLRSIWATLVPAMAIPVSLLATPLIMYSAGFSLNVLTLLAAVLAIGLVVDDAIVVLENIHRRIELGEPPLLAAVRGTQEVGFAVIATTLVLVSVFVPLAFMEDAVGRLFSEFGITMAAAVCFSSFVALTWAPMLSARLLRSSGHHDADSVERGGWLMHRLIGAYRRILDPMLTPFGAVAAFAVLLVALGAGLVLYAVVPQQNVPDEDRGFLITIVDAPQGSSLAYTNAVAKRVEGRYLSMREDGPIDRVIAIVAPPFRPGASPNSAFVIAGLDDYEQREVSQQELQGRLFNEFFFGIADANVITFSPPSFPGIGFGEPLQVGIGADSIEQATAWAERIVAAARAENPRLAGIEVDVDRSRPRLQLSIDRQRAADLGVSASDIGLVLQVLFGGLDVTRFEERGRQYDVILQAEAEQRDQPMDLEALYLRSHSTGQLVPLSSLLEHEEVGVYKELLRIERRPTAVIKSNLAPGYTLSEAIEWISAKREALLPPEAGLTWLEQSRQEVESSAGMLLTFGGALLIVFLVLAAQFESWVHPIVILACVPLAMTGALAGLALAGIALSVYAKIGLIMLIGLMAKNGILIVEFANQLRDRGTGLREAVLEAALLRLRPIMMTAISTVIGAVPLALATGAGAEGRVTIGVVIIGGLIVATILTLLVLPPSYWVLARFSRPGGALQRRLTQQDETHPDSM